MREFAAALLALFLALAPGTKCTGQIELVRVEGPAQLAYDASFEKPVLPTYRQLPSELPAGYDRERLVGSLPERTALTLAFFTYGDTNSRAVAVAAVGHPVRRFFVDRDRDQVFAAAEEVAGEAANEWSVDLDAEFVLGVNQYAHKRRRVGIRLDQRTGALEVATLGCMCGKIALEDQTVDVLRVDATGNGLWFDPDDRFWVDINADGRFDPLREKFACRATCAIGPRQYAVASDIRGLFIQLRQLEGAGRLVPKVTLLDGDAVVTGLEATLVSETGIHAVLRDAASEVEVPVGRYRMCALQVSLQDDRGHWLLRFAGDTSSSVSVEVRKDETACFDPIGKLTLHAASSLRHDDAETVILITPFVTTSTGLYLTGSFAGESAARDPNGVRARSMVETRIVDVGSSGFT